MKLFFFSGFSIWLILFFVFCLTVITLLWHYLYYFARISFYKETKKLPAAAASLFPASIVICARNEDHNLPEFLPLILSQDYPEYEVVVVNDCSWDNTADILSELAKTYSHLKVITIKEDEKHTHGKKFALMLGIKGAKYEHLLFTDSDCKPLSNQWLKKMMRNFSLKDADLRSCGGNSPDKREPLKTKKSEADKSEKAELPIGNEHFEDAVQRSAHNSAHSKNMYGIGLCADQRRNSKFLEVPKTEIVLGYSRYEKYPGLLNKFIRFDTFHIAIQYLSFSMAKIPYMGTGRNLAYKKNLFFRHKGFATHYHIESGDDDLFVNQAATKTNTVTEISPESFTVSRVKKDWNEWSEQKRRHLTTWKEYKISDKIRLGIYSFANALFWLLFAVLLLFPARMLQSTSQYDFYFVIALFILKIIIQMIIFKLAMNKLQERDLLLILLLAELFLLGFYPALTISNWFFRTRKWK